MVCRNELENHTEDCDIDYIIHNNIMILEKNVCVGGFIIELVCTLIRLSSYGTHEQSKKGILLLYHTYSNGMYDPI